MTWFWIGTLLGASRAVQHLAQAGMRQAARDAAEAPAPEDVESRPAATPAEAWELLG